MLAVLKDLSVKKAHGQLEHEAVALFQLVAPLTVASARDLGHSLEAYEEDQMDDPKQMDCARY
jgi:hypothetical protein